MTFLVLEEIEPPILILSIGGAGMCLASYILRLASHVLAYTRPTRVINFRVILVVTFLGYFGWGYWSGVDPVKMNIRTAVSIPIGAALAVAGLGLFLYAELTKHGVGDGDRLVTTGIYRKIRHPMYIGLVLLHVGFPLTFRSFLACLSTILWAAIIAVWTRYEDMNLERRFGRRYLEYKKDTWF